MKRLLLLSAVLLLVAHVRADSETIDGVTYSYTVANGKAIIYNSANNNSYLISIGNDGRISFGGDNYEAAIPQSTTGDLAIPSVVGDYPVTSIGSWSFYGCNGLTSVLIPESVTSIASYAFYGCSNLTNVTITGSVLSIGNGAFHGCSNMTSMILPASVASIGLSAFYGCNKLESVTMRGDAPSVGNHAFSGVASGCVVYVPRQADGYEVDEDGKWQGMTVEYYGPEFTIDANGVLTGVNLHEATEIVIPNSVTSIGDRAFYNCRNLTSVVIPDSVTYIGDSAFYLCSNLTRVVIPDSVIGVGDCAFSYCGLEDANGFVIVRNVLYSYSGWGSVVTIPNGVTRIGNAAFLGCGEDLTSVIIPDSVTSIGNYAFQWCSGLTTINIPDSLNDIGEFVFVGCSGIKSFAVSENNQCYKSVSGSLLSKDGSTLIVGVNDDILSMSESLTSIGDGAFWGFDRSTNMIIPNSVTNIGNSAFANSAKLADIYIADSVVSIEAGAFYGCGNLTNVTMRGDAPRVGNYAFEDIASECVVRIPRQASGYEVDEDGKWQGMTVEYYEPEFTIDENGVLTGVNLNGTTKIVIPDGVTSIGENVFKDCESLRSVIIPEGVKEIGYYAFRSCSSLETIYLPSTVTNIVTAAFEYCTSLKSIEIPAGVTSVGTWLFNGCTSLVSVVMHEGIPSIPYKMFTGCSSLIEIDIPDGVMDIGAEAFRDCRRLRKVTIPNSVASIGARAFWDCNSLAILSIPDSVTSIGYAAFAYCYDLAGVTMGSGVTSIGEYVFWRCSGLKSVTMKGDAPSVGNYAFYYIDSSCIVLLPRGNETYGITDGKWQGMTVNYYGQYYGPEFIIDANGVLTKVDLHGATEVVIPKSVKSIGEGAFEGCSGLTSVTMKGDCPIVGSYAFSDLDLSCVVRLPKGNVTYDVVDGKWQGMRVAWYGGAGEMVLTANGQMLDFVATSDNLSIRTSTVAEGTAADDIVIMSGSNDVTKGYSRKVEGTTATIALLNPYDVPKEEGVADAPWTEDGEGNVKLNVEVVPGLYYAAASAASLDALKCPGADSPATAETTLTVEKPESDTQGFFKVWVSDKAIKAE